MSAGRGAKRAARTLAALVVLCAALSPIASAQGVTGSVRERETGAPLAGVLVSARTDSGASLGAVLTDSVGRFILRVPAGAKVRLWGERIGLETATSDWVATPAQRLVQVDFAMGHAAVRLEGLVVDAPVQNCRVDPVTGHTIQRWWDEARKALRVTSLVQSERLAKFRIYQFEREWTADLRSLVREAGRGTTTFSSRPFTSLEPQALEAGGYVQGPPGRRRYYAPDAEALLSSSFLSTHCFSVAEDKDRPHWMGLMFEPTRERKLVDIRGTFWIDTTTSELKALDFTYANMPDDIPGEEAGGRVEFRYLPSGAWIVPRWWIRAPRVGVRTERVRGVSRDLAEVVAYVDMGGRAEHVTVEAAPRDGLEASGRLSGVVFDSLHGRPLSGALVQLTGTRYSAVTSGSGRFSLDSIPIGAHSVTFFHRDLVALGLPSPVAEVYIGERASVGLDLAVPPFSRAAEILCHDREVRSEAVLVVRLADSAGVSLVQAQVQARWQTPDQALGIAREVRSEGLTGSDGRAVFCALPAATPLQLRVRLDGRWHDLSDITLDERRVVLRNIGVGGAP